MGEGLERANSPVGKTDALVNLLRNTSIIFNPNALFELASRGIPSFAETMTDAKLDLDASLKRACEDLISGTSSRLSLPLRTFLDRCTSFLSSTGAKDLPAQAWATPDAVLKLHEDFHAALGEQTKEVVGKLRVYLNEEKTIGVLLPPLLVRFFFSFRLYSFPSSEGTKGTNTDSDLGRCRMRSLIRTRRSTTVRPFSRVLLPPLLPLLSLTFAGYSFQSRGPSTASRRVRHS